MPVPHPTDPYDRGNHTPKFNDKASQTEPTKTVEAHTTYKTDTTVPSLDLSGGPKPPKGVAAEVNKQVREEEVTRGVTDSKFAKFIQSKYTEMNNENDNSNDDIDAPGDEGI